MNSSLIKEIEWRPHQGRIAYHAGWNKNIIWKGKVYKYLFLDVWHVSEMDSFDPVN